MRIFAFLPSLEEETGHILEYHKSFAEAVRLNKGKYFAYIPKKCSLPNLDKNWKKVLYLDSWEKTNPIKRFIGVFRNILPLYKLIKGQNKQDVVFIEHKIYYIFFVLFLFPFQKIPCKLWVFYRYSFCTSYPRRLFLRWMQFFIKKKTSPEQVSFFTDSTLLQESLKKNFDISAFVLPIPHTIQKGFENIKRREAIYMWWPGSSIREEKGLVSIQKLSNELKSSKSTFHLVVSERAKSIIPPHDKMVYILKNLSREEYEKWMHKADIILLPYLPSAYKKRTSGIFVEAIFMGKLVIVLDQTWMSYELMQFDLQILSLPIAKEFDLQKIKKIYFQKKSIDKKIKKMQKAYQELHSVQGLARKLNSIYF